MSEVLYEKDGLCVTNTHLEIDGVTVPYRHIQSLEVMTGGTRSVTGSIPYIVLGLISISMMMSVSGSIMGLLTGLIGFLLFVTVAVKFIGFLMSNLGDQFVLMAKINDEDTVLLATKSASQIDRLKAAIESNWLKSDN